MFTSVGPGADTSMLRCTARPQTTTPRSRKRSRQQGSNAVSRDLQGATNIVMYHINLQQRQPFTANNRDPNSTINNIQWFPMALSLPVLFRATCTQSSSHTHTDTDTDTDALSLSLSLSLSLCLCLCLCLTLSLSLSLSLSQAHVQGAKFK